MSVKAVLASTSPRRREILSEMGVEFEVCPSDADESSVNASSPKRLVRELSRLKALPVVSSHKDCVVVGADTIVVKSRKIYGKPLTEENAVNMIKELRGAWHIVYTGVTVAKGEKSTTFVVKSKVKFKPLTDEQIVEYVRAFKPLDKAGAYGIQDKEIVLKYKGSYSNIVGLPKEKLAKTLAKYGV